MNEHLHRYATRLLERQQAGAGKVLTMRSYGVHQPQALRDWCDEMLATLEQRGKVWNKRRRG
jgi:hypothetical protein